MSQSGPAGPANDESGPSQSPSWMIGLIAVTFLALAAWFVIADRAVLDHEAKKWIRMEAEAVENHPSTRVVVRPLRESILTDPPIVKIGAYEYKCSECHRLFESAPETARRLVQHSHIDLEHGLNDRCFNCHDRKDRNRLVLHSGETIGFSEVPRLCAKCHGPTFRDWQNGVHGRTDGHWNPAMGPAIQRLCTQCHDPHAPAYGQMEAFGAAEGLRVHVSPEHEEEVLHERAAINPLRRWEIQDRPDAESHGHDESDAESSEHGLEDDSVSESSEPESGKNHESPGSEDDG